MPSPLRTGAYHKLVQWDKDVSYLVYRFYNTHFSRIPLLILEVSGHGVPWIVAPVLIFLFKPQLSPLASALMLNFLALTFVDLATIGLLKPVFRRPRPAYNTGIGHITIHAVDQFSFPSGHATRAGFVASFLYYVRAFHPTALHPVIASHQFLVFVACWALLVCASRVALGRHHIVDVVFGALLGTTYVVVWNPLWIGAAFSFGLRILFRKALLGVARSGVPPKAASAP